LSTGMSEMTHL